MEKTLMVSVKEEPVLNTGKKDSAIEGEKEREREGISPITQVVDIGWVKELPSISLSVHLIVKIKEVCSSLVSIWINVYIMNHTILGKNFSFFSISGQEE